MGLQITQDIQGAPTQPLKEGGLGLPIFKHYYWAANSRALTYWKCEGAEAEGDHSWLQLEATAVKNSSLSSLLFPTSTGQPNKIL